jgi:hypothetical protein
MTHDNRLLTAISIGPTALLRYKAEVILDHEEDSRFAIAEDEREELDRIASGVLRDGDRAFLDGFDNFLVDKDKE